MSKYTYLLMVSKQAIHIHTIHICLSLLTPDFIYDPLSDTYEEVPTAEVSQEYLSWLPLWREQIQPNPVTNQVLPAACRVTTPLNPDVWHHMLISHPDQVLITFFIEKVTESFQIGFNYQCTVLKPARNNMHSANLHPTVVTEYLKTELN